MENLLKIVIPQWNLQSGKTLTDVVLSYQFFGPVIGNAPVVLVNHALTGNSNVGGYNGWWNTLVGEEKTIDTNYFTVIAFNIPGNGFDDNADNLIYNYKDFTAQDVARFFWLGLQQLGILQLHTIIGGSLGGGIAWEMAALEPEKVANLIPVATDWKATDWVVANTLVQDRILNNSVNPIADARLHAILLYRTPQSLQGRFNNTYINNAFAVEHWLTKHGKNLEERFTLSAYKLMNHLLKTINMAKDGSFEAVAKTITAAIHIVAVDTDLLFTADETRKTYEALKQNGNEVYYNEIKSVHGHDAFLIEWEQLAEILAPVFQSDENSKKFHKDTQRRRKETQSIKAEV
ncbi:alpha/beta fold hydrolase [Flavobacterium rivuli]|uniref:alpha/beta fold hydrolase n=1 Tax=Flavobacterium rivuli TaxID=498301 RepID=UPI00035D1323|nr:alpha/beta fold hydrolase [Flavobacterium rivuli]